MHPYGMRYWRLIMLLLLLRTSWPLLCLQATRTWPLRIPRSYSLQLRRQMARRRTIIMCAVRYISSAVNLQVSACRNGKQLTVVISTGRKKSGKLGEQIGRAMAGGQDPGTNGTHGPQNLHRRVPLTRIPKLSTTC